LLLIIFDRLLFWMLTEQIIESLGCRLLKSGSNVGICVEGN